MLITNLPLHAILSLLILLCTVRTSENERLLNYWEGQHHTESTEEKNATEKRNRSIYTIYEVVRVLKLRMLSSMTVWYDVNDRVIWRQWPCDMIDNWISDFNQVWSTTEYLTSKMTLIHCFIKLSYEQNCTLRSSAAAEYCESHKLFPSAPLRCFFRKKANSSPSPLQMGQLF